jgi:t-SNARE complex subunit (syntaxin)
VGKQDYKMIDLQKRKSEAQFCRAQYKLKNPCIRGFITAIKTVNGNQYAASLYLDIVIIF